MPVGVGVGSDMKSKSFRFFSIDLSVLVVILHRQLVEDDHLRVALMNLSQVQTIHPEFQVQLSSWLLSQPKL